MCLMWLWFNKFLHKKKTKTKEISVRICFFLQMLGLLSDSKHSNCPINLEVSARLSYKHTNTQTNKTYYFMYTQITLHLCHFVSYSLVSLLMFSSWSKEEKNNNIFAYFSVASQNSPHTIHDILFFHFDFTMFCVCKRQQLKYDATYIWDSKNDRRENIMPKHMNATHPYTSNAIIKR